MIWLQFGISAALVVIAAQKLAEYGDVIAVRTKLGGMFIGTLLLAAATSLPELLNAINSIQLGVPDLAAGDIFGSCMFNMFMLAILDLIVQRGRILRVVLLKHAISGSLAVLLGILAIMFITAKIPVRVGWVGLDSLLLIGIYVGGVWLLNQNNVAFLGEESYAEEDGAVAPLSVGLIGFGLAALVLILVVPWLVVSAIGVARQLGVSTGFVGAAMVAVVTSLPEMVTTVAAVRIRAFDLAIGNLFGSNCFNIFALGLTDIFYTQGLFLSDVDPVMTLAAIMGVVLTALGLFGNVARVERRLWIIEVDALLIGLAYVFGMWLLYTRGLVMA